MPNLRRCYGAGYLHFITFSCYRRLQFLGSPRRRDLFLRVLQAEQWRWSSSRHYVLGERGPVLVNVAGLDESPECVARVFVSRLETPGKGE